MVRPWNQLVARGAPSSFGRGDPPEVRASPGLTHGHVGTSRALTSWAQGWSRRSSRAATGVSS